MDDLLAEFLVETLESLDRVDTELVHLEQHPDDREVLNSIFRLVHTIKGTCGFFSLSRLEAVAHAAETAFDSFRENGNPVPQEAFPVVLEAIDRIKAILAGIDNGRENEQIDDSGLIHRLEKIAAGDLPGPAAGNDRPVPAPPEEPIGPSGQHGDASPDPAGLHQSESVRVSLPVLDNLMGLVSELVISRNQLLRMVRGQDDSPFIAPLKNLSQVVSGLQDGITLARVQPVQTAWSRLPRIVRDLAYELDKKIVLEMAGGEAELDRQIIEAIKDPLVHMIRNAADHGLESPGQRTAAGKRETGTINLNAWSESGYVIVEMADDGGGIDVNAVTAKAVAAGIITDDEAGDLREAQKAELIFHPGLSTSRKITPVSGRGVGMDVVRSSIERIGGQVSIESTSIKGSVFRLRLPLTLSIIPALIVETGGQKFALPQSCIAELVRAGSGTQYPVDDVNGARLLRLREQTLPLVSLNTCLGLAEPAGSSRPLAIVIRHGKASMALSVDRVLDTEEIVVKPLTPLITDLRNYSGTTILGDGRVVMILDAGGLMQPLIGEHDATAICQNEPSAAGDTDEKVSLVLFRSGAGMAKAVPLSEIERLEQVNGGSIEQTADGWILRHRDGLVPLVSMNSDWTAAQRQSLILFRLGAHRVGLAVDEIIDIEEHRLDIELASPSGLIRGIADFGGGPVEIIDLPALAWQIADRLPPNAGEAAA